MREYMCRDRCIGDDNNVGESFENRVRVVASVSVDASRMFKCVRVPCRTKWFLIVYTFRWILFDCLHHGEQFSQENRVLEPTHFYRIEEFFFYFIFLNNIFILLFRIFILHYFLVVRS